METRPTLIAVALAGAVAGSCVCEQPPDDQPPAAGREDCLNVGDEDSDGTADCADSDCSARFDCADRLLPPTGGIYRHRLVFDEGRFVWGAPAVEVTHGDLTGDGRIDFAFPRYGWTDDDELVHDILIVPSSEWGSPSEIIEVAPVARRVAASQADAGIGPSTRGNCDLDGDGLDDLVAVDTIGDLWSPEAVEGASLRILFGSEDLGVAGDVPAVVVPLGSLVGWLGLVTCLGDVDGDLRDDVIIEMTGDGGGRKILLDVDRLSDAPELADATRRIWGLLADPTPGPDIDGDGLRDIVFTDGAAAPLEWNGLVVQREGWILPGQPSLGIPVEGLSSTEDEERDTKAIFMHLGDDARTAGDPTFGDVDGDGHPEMLVPVLTGWASESRPDAGHLAVFDVNRVRELSDDLLFESEDIVARLLLPTALPSVQRIKIGDVDGDGNPDLLLKFDQVELAAGVHPAWSTGESETWESLAVYFGDGTFDAFERDWTEADVVVLSDSRGSGFLGSLQVVEDIDGTERPGVMYSSETISNDPDAMDKGFGSAGFLPGDWLREGASR